MDEAGAGHRLDDGADRLAVELGDAMGERSQRIDIGRDGELVQRLSITREQTDVNLPSAEIQSGVQH